MIILQQNTNNQFPATVSMNVTISNPVYLFEFQHKLSNEYWYIIPYKVPTAYAKPSYDLFNMGADFNRPESLTNNTATSGNLHLIPGEYLVRVYQQTSTSNLDPLQSQGQIYQIMAVVEGTQIICTPEPPYEGGFDDEWIVYDECQPTPVVSVSATANSTPTPTPTPTVTPTNTATPTQTATSTPIPSTTPTHTPTNTTTPTQTPTSSCPITTQYLEVVLQSCNAFKLALWNQPNYTSTATALCDYVIEGVAYGDMGTIYNGQETILAGQHQHNFNLGPVLQPGECVVAFNVLDYSATTCACPVNLVLPAPNPSPTPTNTATPTNTPTNTTTPTNTPTPTATLPPLDCTWSGTTSLWENNINEWQECSRLPQPTPSATPTTTPPPASPTPTPSVTATMTQTPTPTETPIPPLMFLVSSAATQNDACQIGPFFYVYAEDLGNCGGCYAGGVTCWACLTTSQQVFADANLTIPVGNGYYSNETSSGTYSTWYIVGGFPQGAGFDSCLVGPTPTPTNTTTATPTPTVTPTATNTFCSTYIMDPDVIASWSYNRCDGTLIQRFGETTTYTECVRNGTLNILSGTLIITDLGQCT